MVDIPPSFSTLFDSIALAQRRWRTAQDRTEIGRLRSTLAKVARSMDDHRIILEVLPDNNKYLSLIIGSVTCIVKVGHDPDRTRVSTLILNRLPSIMKLLPWRSQTAWSNCVKISRTGRIKSLPIQISHRYRGLYESFMSWFSSI